MTVDEILVEIENLLDLLPASDLRRLNNEQINRLVRIIYQKLHAADLVEFEWLIYCGYPLNISD